MYGQAGNDTFVFDNDFGNDVIFGFEAKNNLEKIDLSAVVSIVDFADLRDHHMNQVGADVVIDDLEGNTITLAGITIADLLEGNNFIF